MNSTRTILVLLLLAAKLVIGQEIPGSTAKADVNSLQAAVRAHPDNVGLKLRLTQAILLASKEESHPDKKAAAIAEVQALWKACLASNPAAFIPLRALARDAYYARDMSAAILRPEAAAGGCEDGCAPPARRKGERVASQCRNQ